MKKALLVTTIASTIGQFNKINIEQLSALGYEVHVATNFINGGSWNTERIAELKESLKMRGVQIFDIPFSRSPFSMQNIKCYRQLKRLIATEGYTLVHCQTPVAAALTRLCIGKHDANKQYVLYTCHGFNFHKYSSKSTWIKYYPIEHFLSRYTDEIITINKEDYALAVTMKVPQVDRIHGVGVDVEMFAAHIADRVEKRKEIGVPENAFLIVSVGELIPRKNHSLIIKAMGQLKRKEIFYVLCGEGVLEGELRKLAESIGMKENVLFMGFRSDIAEICSVADLTAIPSLIEGLGLAGVESLAVGVPVIGSDVQGIRDYVINGETGICINPNSVESAAHAINIFYDDRDKLRGMRERCLAKAKEFGKDISFKEQYEIYHRITEQIESEVCDIVDGEIEK